MERHAGRGLRISRIHNLNLQVVSSNCEGMWQNGSLHTSLINQSLVAADASPLMRGCQGGHFEYIFPLS